MSEWFGALPERWESKRIGALLQQRKEKNDPIQTDFILSLSATHGVLPYSERIDKGGNKPKNDISKYNIARTNDLLVNCMNVLSGSCGITKWDGAISPVYYALYPRNSEEVNIKYYSYIFRLTTFYRSLIGISKGILVHESSTGSLNTIRLRVAMQSMNYVVLPFPPRTEQDQIVRFLDWKVSKINLLINAKKKQIELLQEQKRAMINEAVTKGGKGWTSIPLKRLLTPISERNRPDLPLLSVVREQGIILRNVEDKEENHNFIPEDLSNYKVVKQGQFVMNKMKAWQGSYGVSLYDGIVSPAYYVFDLKFNYKEFFHRAIRCKYYVDKFAQFSAGIRTGQWDFPLEKIKEIDILIPPLEEQIKIVERIDYLIEAIKNLSDKFSSEISLLQEYRTRLISDVVTGKIDVRDINVPEFMPVDEYSSNDELPVDFELNSQEG